MCICLYGCAQSLDLETELDQVFSAELVQEKVRRNNYSRYLDYYLPSDLHEVEGDMLTNYFSYNDSCFIMDVNISGIVNDRYYPDQKPGDEGFFDEQRLVYYRAGTYRDNEGNEREYQYKVYGYDGEYLSYFFSKDLIFYGYATPDDIVPMSSRILLMAKGTIVREDDVAAGYSLKNEIDYEKKQVNLFETIMPVNGNVNDFFVSDDQESAQQ